MFDQLKKLGSQTALYGLSSILGKVINFLLVPLHTAVLSKAAFGVNTDIYAIIAFFIVILTYGMETSFFRFSEKYADKKDSVYTTALLSIVGTTVAFILVFSVFSQPISSALKYGDSQQYIWWMVVILGMDAISAIPFARLRAENKAGRFVFVKLALIFSNVFFNLLFFTPVLVNNSLPFEVLPYWFGQNLGVGYIFLANLFASTVMLLLLLPQIFKVKFTFDSRLWKEMLIFGLPLLISGLAGVANELLDRQLLKYLLPESDWQEQLGIYGAVYKLSIFLVLFNQAFRYAAEPFFFSNNKEVNAKETFAMVMNYFVMIMATGFVLIMAYLDVVKHFIDEKFWEGLAIVPILLLANLFLGINTNLSFWYKLSDRTNQAIYITGFGLLITLVLNIWLIPIMGYAGAAWATLASYAGMTVLSYFLGQHYYPIPYKTGRILLVVLLAFVFGWLAYHFSMNTFVPQTAFLLAFLAVLAWLERDALQKLKLRLQSRKQ